MATVHRLSLIDMYGVLPSIHSPPNPFSECLKVPGPEWGRSRSYLWPQRHTPNTPGQYQIRSSLVLDLGGCPLEEKGEPSGLEAFLEKEEQQAQREAHTSQMAGGGGVVTTCVMHLHENKGTHSLMNSLEAKDWGALRNAAMREEEGDRGGLDSDHLERIIYVSFHVQDHSCVIVCE